MAFLACTGVPELLPNESRLNCGRNGGGRKELERQTKRLASFKRMLGSSAPRQLERLLAPSARVRHKRRQLRRGILDLVLTNYDERDT